MHESQHHVNEHGSFWPGLLVCGVVCAAIGLGYVGPVRAEEVTVDSYVPAPGAVYDEIQFNIARDYDDGKMSRDPDVGWYVDPSGTTRLRKLRVVESMTIEGDLEVFGKTTSRKGFYGPFFEDTDPFEISEMPAPKYLRVDPSGTSQFVATEANRAQAAVMSAGLGLDMTPAKLVPPQPKGTGVLNVYGSMDLRGPIYNTEMTWDRPNTKHVQIWDITDLAGDLIIDGNICGGDPSKLIPCKSLPVTVDNDSGFFVNATDKIHFSVGNSRTPTGVDGVEISGKPTGDVLLKTLGTGKVVFADGDPATREVTYVEELVVLNPRAPSPTFGGLTLGDRRRTTWPQEVGCSGFTLKSWPVDGGGRLTANCSGGVVVRLDWAP